MIRKAGSLSKGNLLETYDYYDDKNADSSPFRLSLNGKSMARTLKSIRNLSVAITGECWIPRSELVRRIKKNGILSNEEVATDYFQQELAI